MRFLPKFKLRQNGQILATLVVTMPFLMLMVASYLTLSTSDLRLARSDQLHTQAQLAADAGADYAVEQINTTSNYTGSSETVLHNDGSVKTTYTETITNNSSSSKTLTSVGKTYWPTSSATVASSVTIKVDLQAISQGTYSIVSGEGGLIMSNSAKIVAGDIFINGTITMSNNSQIGLSTNSVNVNVANQACPLTGGATYPRLCNSGENDNPITVNNPAHIYGTVKANFQTSGTRMSNPGLTSSSGVAAQALPSYDRAGQKAAVSTTLNSGFSCNNGSQTWLANTKIVGNASISGSCVVTVQGNVWITGNLTVSNTGKLVVSDSLGANRPNIMIDGTTGASFTNAAQMASNSSGTGFELYTFANSTGNPDATLTGADLFSSRNTVSISLANSTTAPQTIFYAYWSRVQIANTGAIGALIGQSVELKNAGTITFGTSVPSGGSTYWIVNGYRRSF